MPFVNSTKSLVFDLTEILLPKRLVLIYCLILKVIHFEILFTELKSSYVQFYLGSHFPNFELWLLINVEKWITLSFNHFCPPEPRF